MKKIIIGLLVFALVSNYTFAQTASDSTKITISVQARDLEIITGIALMNGSPEDLYDSVKVSFRVANPPTGTTSVPVTAMIMDWVSAYQKIIESKEAWHFNTKSRLEALLNGSGNSYLVGKISDINTGLDQIVTNLRQTGRRKLRKQ